MGEWVVGPWMARELRETLREKLDARDGDTVVLFGDGAVALGRQARPLDAALIRRHLQPFSSRQGAMLGRPSRRASDRSHLQIVPDDAEDQTA